MTFQNRNKLLNSKKTATFSIYRSSAGSGKTYQLAIEFISLAIKNPNLFNKILAVTFTNKATKEMKERILSFLLKLANPRTSSTEKEDTDLLNQVKQSTNLSEEAISSNSSLVISKILHQYSQFSISTIDAFFQKIVKSFAKELGLLGNFKVELDQDMVKQEIIDQIIDELGDDKVLTNWLVDFSFSKLDDNKSWNIRPQIESLANEVFKESFRPVEDTLNNVDIDGFKNFLAQVRQIKIRFENNMKPLALEAIKLIESHGLEVDDFIYKSGGPAGYFGRILSKKEYDPKARVKAALADPGKWFSKSSPKKAEIQQVVEAGLQDITKAMVDHYNEHVQEYTTAEEVLRNFYVFGILSQITKKLKIYRRENDVMLISDIPVFLKRIIAENDAPFIYEKTGAWYQHYLIDEFQDTSGFQWQNFKPLVENGLAQEYKSLLVGDGKQSIYRWRGGDWNIILHQVSEDLKTWNPIEKQLNINWRSARKIIEFNNNVFSYLPSLITMEFQNQIEELKIPEAEKIVLISKTEDVEQLYLDVVQEIAIKNQEPSRGRIEINSYLKDSEIPSHGRQAWKEDVLTGLPGTIERLQNAGYKAGEIAVLVRKTDEARKVIESLIQYKNSAESHQGYCYDDISNESLYLGNAPIVRLLINCIKYFHNPEDKIALAEVCFNYHHLTSEKPKEHEKNDLKFMLDGSVLPVEFFNESESLIRLQVYEMVERIVQLLKIGNSEQKGYLQAFQDVVLDYFSAEGKDVNDFLIWWEEKGKRKSIQLPGSINAIKVMTIHKSKGLEFKAVLVPFCDWKLDHDAKKDNFLWCTTNIKPFDQIGWLPLKYSSNLDKTYFAADYFEEKIKAHIDNLNLLYVALTRAEDFLMINCPPPSKNLSLAGDLVIKVIEKLTADQGQPSVEIREEKAKIIYSIGQLNNLESEHEPSDNYSAKIAYKSSDWRENIAIRRKGKSFFEKDPGEKRNKINYGLLVHEILASIKNEQEAQLLIKKYYSEGKISKEDQQTLIDQLYNIFSIPQVREWFNTDWEIKAEIPIISTDNQPKRPDRVLIHGTEAIVIDFKTGFEKSMDRRQVLEYRDLLREMGYSNVSCYLLYIGLNKVVQL